MKPQTFIFVQGYKSSSLFTGAIRPNRFKNFLIQRGHLVIEKEIILSLNFLSFIKLIISSFEFVNLSFKYNTVYLFCSGSPFMNFIFSFSKLFNKKIIVILEYRDPWHGDVMRNTNILYNFLLKKIEIVFCSFANQIFCISEEIKQANPYFKKYGGKKFKVISTEFSSEELDFFSHDKVLQNSVGHFGNIDRYMSIEKTRNLIDLNLKFNFKFWGTWDKDAYEIFNVKSKKNVSINDRESLHNSYKEMYKCQILLLMGSETSQRFHRKVLEYLFLNKPIIYFGSEESPTAKLLKEFSSKYVINPPRNFDISKWKSHEDKDIQNKFIQQFDSKIIFKEMEKNILLASN